MLFTVEKSEILVLDYTLPLLLLRPGGATQRKHEVRGYGIPSLS